MAAKKNTQNVKVTLVIAGKTYKASGLSVSDALRKLTPEDTKQLGFLSVSHGSKTYDKLLSRTLIHKLYGKTGNLMKEVAYKQVATILPA